MTNQASPVSPPQGKGAARDLSWRVQHKRVGWLFLISILSLTFLMNTQNPNDYEFSTLLLASMAMILACLPTLRWLFQGFGQGLPFFELYMLFYAVCFGFSGFIRMKSTLVESYPVSEEDWRTALLFTIVSLLFHAVGYYFYRKGKIRSSPSRWPFNLNRQNVKLVAPYIFFTCLSIYLVAGWIPETLKQVLLGCAYFYFLVLVVATFQRHLSPTYQVLVKLLLIPAVAVTFSGFSKSAIAGLAGTLMAVGLARFAANRKIPVFMIIMVVGAYFFFQPGKHEYRSQQWYSSSDSEQPGAIDFVSISWQKWIDASSKADFPWGVISSAFSRLNHLHVTAAVMADTPGRNPFRYGETYLPLIYKIIPRAIWPDKPREDFGNRWAREYGYLSSKNLITSFNLPWLPEMYMNFGILGVIIISFLVGRLMGFLSERFWSRSGDSTFTAFSILLGMPFLTPESNLSLMLGMIVISAIVAYGTLLALNLTFPKGAFRKYPPVSSHAFVK